MHLFLSLYIRSSDIAKVTVWDCVSCPLHISHILYRICMKLGSNVNLTEPMCRRHESAILASVSCPLHILLQYSQRGTFIWTPVTAIYLNVFAENDHRDRCFFADISSGHRCSIAHGSKHRATRCTNTADPDGLTRRSLILYNLHVQCRRWKTVDRDDPLRATTANPRVRSSRYPRVMTTRVNGCSVFDRAWIILTTGVRGFMKVPRWLYCISYTLWRIFMKRANV